MVVQRTDTGQESLRDQLTRGREEVQQVRIDFMAIAGDVQVLARKEVELARAELSEQVAHVTRGAALGGVALVMALLTLVFVGITTMLVLDTFLPIWLAALITTLAVAAIAVIAGVVAMRQFKSISLTPKRTMQSIREDIQWVRSLTN